MIYDPFLHSWRREVKLQIQVHFSSRILSVCLQAVLRVMRQRHVTVDVQTFGSLALGCQRQKEGLQLLTDMEVMSLLTTTTTDVENTFSLKK